MVLVAHPQPVTRIWFWDYLPVLVPLNVNCDFTGRNRWSCGGLLVIPASGGFLVAGTLQRIWKGTDYTRIFQIKEDRIMSKYRSMLFSLFAVAALAALAACNSDPSSPLAAVPVPVTAGTPVAAGAGAS